MKILLISPSSGKWRSIGKHRFFNGKLFRFSMLSLLTVASLTPEEDQTAIIDEQVEDIPFNGQFDLVGITAMTATAQRAYRIAEVFRSKNVPVVMGGFHPTYNPDEVLLHADAVVLGPAYEARENLIADVKRNALKKRYYGNPEGIIPKKLPHHILNKDHYVTINSTYTTLGCTNTCQFCSVNSFHKGKRYVRPIEDVHDELNAFREKFFVFANDNLTRDREYIFAILEKIAPLKKKWITRASVEISDDEELPVMLVKADCIGLFIGLESLSKLGS